MRQNRSCERIREVLPCSEDSNGSLIPTGFGDFYGRIVEGIAVDSVCDGISRSGLGYKGMKGNQIAYNG